MRPEKPLRYEDLPVWLKDELFLIHNHDKKGKIVYDEDDIVRILHRILNHESHT